MLWIFPRFNLHGFIHPHILYVLNFHCVKRAFSFNEFFKNNVACFMLLFRTIITKNWWSNNWTPKSSTTCSTKRSNQLSGYFCKNDCESYCKNIKCFVIIALKISWFLVREKLSCKNKSRVAMSVVRWGPICASNQLRQFANWSGTASSLSQSNMNKTAGVW